MQAARTTYLPLNTFLREEDEYDDVAATQFMEVTRQKLRDHQAVVSEFVQKLHVHHKTPTFFSSASQKSSKCFLGSVFELTGAFWKTPAVCSNCVSGVVSVVNAIFERFKIDVIDTHSGALGLTWQFLGIVTVFRLGQTFYRYMKGHYERCWGENWSAPRLYVIAAAVTTVARLCYLGFWASTLPQSALKVLGAIARAVGDMRTYRFIRPYLRYIDIMKVCNVVFIAGFALEAGEVVRSAFRRYQTEGFRKQNILYSTAYVGSIVLEAMVVGMTLSVTPSACTLAILSAAAASCGFISYLYQPEPRFIYVNRQV